MRLNSGDYTVGIICALPLERTAVELLLDGEPHENLPIAPGDNNVYTFGSIGPHNVVIASLDEGAYGTVTAAGVANDLRRSFPSVRYGLMVGIAGAVPRPGAKDGDLRLGDVVIGCVTGVPSIINYGLGKDGEGDFDMRSEIPGPPEAISRALSALLAQHRNAGPTYLLHLAAMLQKAPRLDQPLLPDDYYNLPDVEDQLFDPTFVHIRGNENCQACRERSEPLVRQPRRLRAPPSGLTTQKFVRYREDGLVEYPVLFCGTIGSSDTLIRSATRRKRIYELVEAQRKAKVLCFEMEASGIARAWPCLVIRGLCDYSDSHKNDRWQNFAAATAAACAKDLLLRIPAQEGAKVRPSNDGPSQGSPSSSARPSYADAMPREPPTLPSRSRQPPPLSPAERQEQNRQLMAAAGNGDLDRMQQLCRNGADVNYTVRHAHQPTALAVAVDAYKLWKDVLERPSLMAPLDTTRRNMQRYAEVVGWLYEQGADFNALSEPRKLAARDALNSSASG